MSKKKLFTVEIKYVEHYSSRVLVLAENEEAAKAQVQKEWDGGDDYLHDKTTECPDDCSVEFLNAQPVSDENVKAERMKCLLSETVDGMDEEKIPNTRIIHCQSGGTAKELHCLTYLSVLVAFREFVFDKANSGRFGYYPADDTFNDAVEEGFSENDTIWTSRNGDAWRIETELKNDSE